MSARYFIKSFTNRFIKRSIARVVFALTWLISSWHSPLFASKVEILNQELNSPWSLTQLPDGRFLVTEKNGRLLLLSNNGKLDANIDGVPASDRVGQGGLLEVSLHPNFIDNHWVYLSYSAGNRLAGYGLEVVRAKLKGNKLTDHKVIFVARPKVSGGRHFGGRLLFDQNGYLYIGLGDRGKRHEAQDISNHIGTLVRLHDDGRIPADNPFVDKAGAKPEIFSYGHRNIQGLALHPLTGEIWAHEHGPQGGDEVNLISLGKNYGWPTITYGKEYGSGFKIGEGTEKKGIEQPLHYWVPSIAPSGMAFYQSDLLVGALKHRSLVELTINNNEITNEKRFFKNNWGRIRDVHVDNRSDEAVIYILTDSSQAQLLKIKGF